MAHSGRSGLIPAWAIPRPTPCMGHAAGLLWLLSAGCRAGWAVTFCLVVWLPRGGRSGRAGPGGWWVKRTFRAGCAQHVAAGWWVSPRQRERQECVPRLVLAGSASLACRRDHRPDVATARPPHRRRRHPPQTRPRRRSRHPAAAVRRCCRRDGSGPAGRARFPRGELRLRRLITAVARRPRSLLGLRLLRVECLVAGQHCYELANLSFARLGAFGGVDAIDQGETVGLGEDVEHGLGGGVGGDRG